MKKLKYIKSKKLSDIDRKIIMQNWILETTNAGLISLEVARLCSKFIKDLKKIPLSEELQ